MFCLSVDLKEYEPCESGSPYYLLTKEEYQALQQVPGPIPSLKPSDVGAVFTAAFTVVVLFFIVGRGVGEVLRFIRGG